MNIEFIAVAILLLILLIVISLLFMFIDKIWIKILFASSIMLLFLTLWAIMSATMPIEIDQIKEYEIKTVTFPNGIQKQMFNDDNGTFINTNKMFGLTFSKDAKLKRVIYKNMYFGIYWPESRMKYSPYLLLTEEEKEIELYVQNNK